MHIEREERRGGEVTTATMTAAHYNILAIYFAAIW